jgi:chromosome segregation protein
MRIKRLDISGFKSFMDRVVFTFHDGITGIVGPNGCGKSNVVDAIRWAMGEQSAKHLRGRSMEDVIFNGSESKPALGMAEVTITFHNDHPQLLPVHYQGFGELAVTRRLFRNGESEYLINKTVCRLIDVTELFLGTGVGTKAYSIIEQGRIGLIVSAKPEDRRSLIEEAAGVTRYKSRRRAAERKMEYTEQNLLRVGDISAELGRRLGVLERQAKKAERYKELKAQMKDIELHAAALRFLELTVLGRAAAQVMEGLSGEERALAAEVLAAEAAIEELKAKLGEGERALLELNERAHRADNAIKVGDANLEAYGREIEEATRRAAEAERELAQIAQSDGALKGEHQALLAQKASLDALASDDEKRLLEVREELSLLAEDEQGLGARLDQERSLLVSTLSRIAAGKSHRENLVRQKTDLDARLARAQKEHAEIAALAQKLEHTRCSFVEKLGASRQLKLALEERRAGEEEALSRARRELMENEARLIAVREELSERKHRLQSLREIERNYEGYGRGVRAVMAQKEARAKGVLGLVSDAFRAEARVEKAIEALLGDRLQTVVVRDRDAGLSLATFLKEGREGRGAFLPLSVASGPLTRGPLEERPSADPFGSSPRTRGPLEERPSADPFGSSPRTRGPLEERPSADPFGSSAAPTASDPSVPGIVGAALKMVSFEPEYAPLVQHLLGNVVVVEDLAAAVAYSRTGKSHTVVTLDGEVFEPTGEVVGGLAEGPGVGALQKKREIAELAERVVAIDGEHQLCQERHRRLCERIEQIEGALKGLTGDTHSEALSVVEQEKDLHKASEDLCVARERLERLAVEVDELQRTLSEVDAEETSACGGSAQAEGEREGRETRVRELSEALSSLRARMGELNAERTRLQVKVAADVERRDGVEKGLLRAQATLLELSERQARLSGVSRDAAERQGALVEKVAQTSADLERLGVEHASLDAEREAARAACDGMGEALRAAEAQERAQRRRLEELQGGLSQHALRERECTLELEHLAATVRDRYATELSQELSRYHALRPPSPEQEEKLKDLREQVERMGEINLTAIEEHSELTERHGFLVQQKKDLEQSLSQLKKAIVRINRTSKERFEQTFEVINEKFQQVFPRLFNGGRAGLVLVQGEDGGEAGIEIMAQPPGKKLQSVNLLSGGEKALTAVALIFAIFLIKPTPFCLLDEVDAPLDEANVNRYNDLVREMSTLSQFILITHNKRTMQIVDTMYGVTMEEPGVSKVVGVRLSQRAQEDGASAPAATG